MTGVPLFDLVELEEPHDTAREQHLELRASKRVELTVTLQMARAAEAAALPIPAARNYGWAAALSWALEAPADEALS